MERRPTTAEMLRDRLDAVIGKLWSLLSVTPILRSKPLGFVMIPPPSDFYWGPLTPELQALQHEVKREYEPIFELLQVLLRQAPEQLGRDLGEANRRFRHWLELDERNYALTPDVEANETAFRNEMSAFDPILETLTAAGAGRTFVVPDTNSLLAQPDPLEYRAVAGTEVFAFMLLPAVLGELDRLKTDHRNPDVREKALKMINRAKGWRLQGSLNQGVTVHQTITVQAIHREPSMGETLSWLDRDVQDDRIIASILELQTCNPGSSVVLVTGDINLQNKADAALITAAETP